MDGERTLTLSDVKAVASKRFNKKHGWKTAVGFIGLLMAILVFGVPAMALDIDTNSTRIYESRWGEEVIVTPSQVTIEGMVLERVDEPKAGEYTTLKAFLVALMVLSLVAVVVYLGYWVNAQNKFVGNFTQKWVDDPMNLPEDLK